MPSHHHSKKKTNITTARRTNMGSSAISLLLSALFLSSAALAFGRNPLGRHRAVFDTDGDELQNGGEYLIHAANQNLGPATLTARNHARCPVNVAMNILADPLPVRIRSDNSDSPTINQKEDIHIEFKHAPQCVHSREWALQRTEESGENSATLVVVQSSDNEQEAMTGQFQITKAGGQQGMNYAIRARTNEGGEWNQLGLSNEGNNQVVRYMGLADNSQIDAVEFVFEKAKSEIRMKRAA